MWSGDKLTSQWATVEHIWEAGPPGSTEGAAAEAVRARTAALESHGTVSSRGVNGGWDIALVYGEADVAALWDALARAVALWRPRKSKDIALADTGIARARRRVAGRAAGTGATTPEPPLPEVAPGGAHGVPSVPGQFVDLGSGAGRAVFAAAAMGVFELARGVEVDALLHEAAVAAGRAVEAATGVDLLVLPGAAPEAGSGTPGAAAAEAAAAATVADEAPPTATSASSAGPTRGAWTAVSLEHGDLRTADWSGAAVVFVTATCFPLELMRALARRCEKLKPGSVVVSTGQRVESPLLEDAGMLVREMPWGPSKLFFSRRARGGQWLANVLRR